MRGSHAHQIDQVFMGGPNKSGHDEFGSAPRGLTGAPFVLFVFFVVQKWPGPLLRSWAEKLGVATANHR
jgi:hypothetical protein